MNGWPVFLLLALLNGAVALWSGSDFGWFVTGVMTAWTVHVYFED